MGKTTIAMSSKLFTTALMLVTIVPFTVFATQSAVEVTDTLHKQTDTLKQVTAKSDEIKRDLEVKQEVKEQTKQEVVQTEQQVNDVVSERQKLEAELGEN